MIHSRSPKANSSSAAFLLLSVLLSIGLVPFPARCKNTHIEEASVSLHDPSQNVAPDGDGEILASSAVRSLLKAAPPPPRRPSPPPPPAPAVIYLGGSLPQGKSLVSPSGVYSLVMQPDGNLAIYKADSSSSGLTNSENVVWDLTKYGAWPTTVEGPFKMALKVSDANLVVVGAAGSVVWGMRLVSVPEPGPYAARLTDAGVLQLEAAGVVYWTSECPPIPAGYNFRPFKDHLQDNIVRAADTASAAVTCSGDCRCRAFTSDGWLKTLSNVTSTLVNCTCCGLYVRENPSICAPPPPSPRPPLRPPPSPKPPPRPSPRPPRPSPLPPHPRPPSPNPPPAPVTLFPGQSLAEGTYVESSGGAYRLWMQSDGNLVIYKAGGGDGGDNNATGKGTVVWDLTKYGVWPTKVGGPYKMVLKATDGNLVVVGAKGATVWATRLASLPPPPYSLTLSDEGGVLQLLAAAAAAGTVYWTSECPPIPEGFTFLPLKDHPADTYAHPASINISSAAKTCIGDCQCRGFTSDGALKTLANVTGTLTNCTCCGLYVRDKPVTCSPPSPPPIVCVDKLTAVLCNWYKSDGYCSGNFYYQSPDKNLRTYWCPVTCGVCDATAGPPPSPGPSPNTGRR